MVARFAKQTYSFSDAKGVVGRMVFGLTYDTAETTPDAYAIAANMATAVANASNGYLFSASGPYSFLIPRQYGTRADYVDAEDKAVLTFMDTDGVLHRFSVPAPKAALFMADGQTVSAASSLLIAIATALATAVGSAEFGGRGGGNFTTAPAGFVGGQRQRRKTQRKITIWTLSGGLDEPAE